MGFVILAALWEMGRATEIIPPSVAPSVAEIVIATVDELREGRLRDDLFATVRAWAGGLATAIAIGLPLGMLTGVSRWADAAGRQLVDFLRPVPAVSLIPVAIVVFGLGMSMQYFLVGFACVWPILINARYGARNVDPLLLDAARAMGCGPTERLRRVVLPAAMPSVATGLRLSATIGVIVAVAAQMVAGSPGLGRYIIQAQNSARVPEMYAGVLLASLLGWLINAIALRLEARFVTARSHAGQATS